jgi:type II secretory pathway component PulF
MAKRLGMKTLANFSDQLGTMLDSGLALSKALDVIGRNARPGVRSLARRLALAVSQGDSFSMAIEREGRRFPILYRRLALVGEETGGLPLVLKRLGAYYLFLRKLWIKFFSSLIYPAFNYFALVGIIAVVASLAGDMVKNTPIGGLTTGTILIAGISLPFVLAGGYFAVTRLLGGLYVAHAILMSLPIIASVMRAMAIGRFAWCMQLMTDSGVNIINAIKWSFEASGNEVFVHKADNVVDSVKNGISLTESLRKTGQFPYDFLQLLETGEESGEMPAMLGKLSDQYQDKTSTALSAISKVVAFGIWACVAGAIVYFIFTMYGVHMQGIKDVMPGSSR